MNPVSGQPDAQVRPAPEVLRDPHPQGEQLPVIIEADLDVVRLAQPLHHRRHDQHPPTDLVMARCHGGLWLAGLIGGGQLIGRTALNSSVRLRWRRS
jgi:hypothetical protein